MKNSINAMGEKSIIGYTRIPNHIIFDTEISLRARGLLSLMLSRPPGWKIYVNELIKHSQKEGKSSIQKALRELVENGYLILAATRQQNSSKINGKHYCLTAKALSLSTSNQSDFEKIDEQKNRSSEAPTVAKSDNRNLLPNNNTESDNKTKNLNKKEQQQQENSSAAAADFFIDYFFENLTNDNQWQAHFLKERKSVDAFISEYDICHLLSHFRDTSIRKGITYKTLFDVKKHFTNWFNQQKEKGRLEDFIHQKEIEQKKVIQQINILCTSVFPILDKRKEHSFENFDEVLLARENLSKVKKEIASLLPFFSLAKHKTEIMNFIHEIEEVIDLINRGEKANRLDWFCENAKPIS